MIEDNEIVLKLRNGGTLRCGPSTDELMYGGYVRICDKEGNEILYWDQQEWADDPELVMGAIFGASIQSIEELTNNHVLEDGIWRFLPSVQ